MATPEQIEQAAQWAAEEYEKRTLAIARNEKVSVYWCHPSYRVDWHEICAKFQMKVMGPTDRTEFQPIFRREMKKRKLLKVLAGKEHADEWAKRIGKI